MLKVAVCLLAFVVVFASLPLLAADQKAGSLLVDGFEKMIVGDELPMRGSDEWICREKCKVVVADEPKPAAEGKRFLRAVAGGEPLTEPSCKHLKIEDGATEGCIHRSLASLGIGPEQIQGKRIRFSLKARGKGYLQFYLYRYAANGGGVKDGSNPYSPTAEVSPNWEVAEWSYLVPPEPEAAEYRVAIHFFTYDARGIDLDDLKVEAE